MPRTQKKTPPRRLVLFDVHAILHRSYHALPNFTSSKGEATGGLYGLSSMVMKILAELKPDYAVACYDLPEPTFRKQVYEEYKGKRPALENDLVEQIERSHELFTAFGIPIYAAAGFEADDIIGTIATATKKEKNLQVIIASGDMDTLQLIEGERVVVYTLKTGINDTVIYDESKVIERFGFSPELLPDYKGFRGDPSDNIIGVKGIGDKTATTLIATFGTVENVYKTLKKHEAKLLAAGLTPRLVNLLKESEEEALFSKTLATIRRDAPIDFELPTISWREGRSFEAVERYFQGLEFRSLVPRARTLFGAATAETNKTSIDDTDNDPLEFKKARLALWVLDSEQTNPSLDDIRGRTKTETLTAALAALEEELRAEKLWPVYADIELPLIPILEAACRRGVLIDRPYLEQLSTEYHAALTDHERTIYRLAGHEFNINSSPQLASVLFDDLGLSVKGLKKTAGGARSTRESELEKLKELHPIIAEILAYRELQKLLSTYIDALPRLADAAGRVHTTLNQAGTTTGRMSSSDPNLQNIPVREGLGTAVRRAFIATPGHRWVTADYSQIEMRVLAELSGDEKLQGIFARGEDIHASVAALVFGVAPDAVTKDMRRQAKVINFGIIYGMGVNALRVNLGGSRAEAEAFYQNYFETFPTIRNYFETVKGDARRRGYTETRFGRRRYFPGLRSRLPYVKAMNERMAMNAPLQGTAADIVKIAMRQADTALCQAGLDARAHLVLQVHDELIYEIETDAVAAAVPVIRGAMTAIPNMTVPLEVNIATTDRWGE